jgi:hypothetical protein
MEFWKSRQNNVNIQTELTDIDNEYNQILDKCHENHDIIDVELFKLENQNDQGFKLSIPERISFRFKIIVSWCFPCVIFVVVPPIVITLLLIFVS